MVPLVRDKEDTIPRMRRFLCALVVCGAISSASAQQSSSPPPAPLQEHVDVVGVTPVQGVGIPITRVPANVQVFDQSDVARAPAGDGASFLAGRATSVQINEAQGGTFQPDVVFRGFVASPLLGASEGLAVYVDGVRANDPFGDTIAWDVLPDNTIASIAIVPGSNPLFGLNALGGAVSLRTKDGFDFASERFTFTTGSFGRQRVDGESGGHAGAFGYYVSGSFTQDDGWRDFSPSTVRRLFGDISWRGSESSVDISVAVASNALTGNGTAPLTLLADDRASVFTHPDEADNDVTLLTTRMRRSTGAGSLLEGVVYYRYSTLATFNGDAAGQVDGDAGEALFDATNNRSRTRGHGVGGTGQWTRVGQFVGRDNHFVAAMGMDASTTKFGSATEFATLTSDRGTIGSGVFDQDAAVDLRSRSVTMSASASETWSLTPRLTLSAAARFNWTAVELRDQIGTELNGDHTFARVNPSVGLTFQWHPRVNVYGSYGESSRVPSPVELTCADPEDPCRLPNAFVSDPPLNQIVARTWEAGARGRRGPVEWSSAAFLSEATDDIIFVSSGARRGEGHFTNVERTRRAGVETSVEVGLPGRVAAFGSYTLQRATFGTDLRLASVVHPDAVDSEIEVPAGSRIPGIPVHSGKAGISWAITSRIMAGAQLVAQSGAFFRGDEPNLLPEVPGFARLDLQARYRIDRRVSIIGHLQNALDHDYSTFGALGDASLIGDDDPRFLSPGQPRGIWAGVEVGF